MSTQPVTQTLARLGASHGYRLEGDTVFLNASFHADASADSGRAWFLRLVAGADAPAGHVITEVPLPPLSELTGAVENYETSAAALAPAARGFHPVSLVLGSRDASGAETIHDHATYARTQAFAQPRLSGPVGLWFESEGELVLDLDRVENFRPADNLSGTLSVEVWALAAPYAGGLFEGRPVAGAILGSLSGGDSWHPGALHLRAAKPAADAHLVVMLREWNGAAYVTRDFVNFTPAPRAAAITAPVSPAQAATPTEQSAPAPATDQAPAAKETRPAKKAAAKKPATPAAAAKPAASSKPAKSSKKSGKS